LVFTVLAAVHTWPMPSAPRHWSRVEGDGALNIWAAGWVGHTLVHGLDIKNGNIWIH